MEATRDEPARTVRATAGDGATSQLLLVGPPDASRWLYWLPAMGVPAKHYLPLAQALAARGTAVALHEWRGNGSSDRRAGRGQNWGYRTLLGEDLPAGLAAARATWPQAPCWMGGHSLGGQLAAAYVGMQPEQAAGLVLVASGAPYWRRFRHAWLIGAAYVAAPALADAFGHFPGRRIGFGGNEARGVIRDWARSGRTGRYAVQGLGDLEVGMASFGGAVLALRLRDDWLGPAASLEWLLGKLPGAQVTRELLTPQDLQAKADHFSWMKAPQSVAARIADWLDRAS
ncbi:MAG TPA: alpha/beta fold hydrolase [Frateuria sp.]|uniref:alpha/beta hydrolase family protein n=1 Tax=Frateuria sp. TaxID=2211372 RepID=UPI002DF6BDEE|nr:alpha/beta fold hydrolase [Frateuria sp.]